MVSFQFLLGYTTTVLCVPLSFVDDGYRRRITCHGMKLHSWSVQYCWVFFVKKVKASGGRFFNMSVVMAVCPGVVSLAV